jgi:two-component system chemotaxis response regulator CheB
MSGHNIIVIGGSAGSVQEVISVVRSLPGDLPAAIFVVVHTSPEGPGVLPKILDRAGALSAKAAADRDAIRPGQVYVAPPDRHLLVKADHVRVVRGPRENLSRPAIDPLFRTAARWHGRHVVGVVLSGNLDDGTAGLIAVRRRGGAAIVQDPDDAAFAPMPRSAITFAGADHIVSVAEIAPLLIRLANEPVPGNSPHLTSEMQMEADIAEMEEAPMTNDERPGTPSGFSCPECSGALWEILDGQFLRYRCRVGHGYSPETLLAAQKEQIEGSLWRTMDRLKERANLLRRLAETLQSKGENSDAAHMMETADELDRKALRILHLLRHEGLTRMPTAAEEGSPEEGQ